MTSWELFRHLARTSSNRIYTRLWLWPHGEGYLRLTAFGSRENTIRAVERIKTLQF